MNVMFFYYIQGSRRNLRSDCIPLQHAGPIDVELDFAFSLQVNVPFILHYHMEVLSSLLRFHLSLSFCNCIVESAFRNQVSFLFLTARSTLIS